jgi:hypothetical protein
MGGARGSDSVFGALGKHPVSNNGSKPTAILAGSFIFQALS